MRSIMGALLSISLAGCASAPAVKPSTPTAPPAAAAPPARAARVDPNAQKLAYERGVALFASERYEDARREWQQTIQAGPNTALASRARANIARVDAMLRNLKELSDP